MARRSPEASLTPPRGGAGLNRVFIFAALCALCGLIVVVYVYRAVWRSSAAVLGPAADTPATADVLASIVTRPHLLFLDSPSGDAYRRVAVVPLDAPDGPRYLTPLQCQRVYLRSGRGLCLGKNYVGGVASTYNAFSFDNQFHVEGTYDQTGTPTRVRLSPDGQLGAMTVFVSGHSYADAGFSTQTTLVDMDAKHTLVELEKFQITRDGTPFQSVDFNFWGVTFARDHDRFYATLGSGGKTYLIEGSVTTRQARVLAENVECPSLSADETRIAFKQRTADRARVWRLAILDLGSLAVSTVAAETRSVDDQIEWLDDNHVLYAMQAEGSLATNIWVAAIDGSDQPRLFVEQALSPAVVR